MTCYHKGDRCIKLEIFVGVHGFAFGARVSSHSLNGLRQEYGTLLPAHRVDETFGPDMIDVMSLSDYIRDAQ